MRCPGARTGGPLLALPGVAAWLLIGALGGCVRTDDLNPVPPPPPPAFHCSYSVEQPACPANQVCASSCGSPPAPPTCIMTSSLPEGASCTFDSDCPAGLACTIPLAGGPRQCRRWCNSSRDCPQGTCVGRPTCGAALGAREGAVCDGICNVVTGAGCAGDENCRLDCENLKVVACVPAGLGTQGTPCTGGGDCARGYLCTGGVPTCSKHCELNDDCTPWPGTTCRDVNCAGGPNPEVAFRLRACS
jgi:hypothetical protein